MDLTIRDVADMFNVKETTVLRWISDGKIPTYRINQLHPDYRFSIPEMENWLISHKLSNTHEGSPFSAKAKTETTTQKGAGGSKQFSLFRAIHKGDVLRSVPGKTKEDVIRTTMKRVAKTLHLDADVTTELLLDREKLMPTALNNGIGVPHARDTLLGSNNDIVLVVFPDEPLDYGALDGNRVHTLFFLFACEDKRHLHLLAKIAHLSNQPHVLEFFKSQPTKEKLLEFVKDWEGNI